VKTTIKVECEIPVIKIALSGRLRSGKDTCANHLYIKYGFDRVAFGDALKRTVNEVFPWVTGPNKPRALLQQYGQLMRQVDGDVWIKHAERAVKGAIDFRVNTGAENVGVVITDLRQPNEYEWARANGFTIIRVTAPDEDRLFRAKLAGDDFNEADLEHETESHIDGFAVDAEIVNDGSIDDLKRRVDEILQGIEVRYLMGNRDIQTVIKEAAERYGLDYDINRKVMTVQSEDGSVREVSQDDFLKAFADGEGVK
jgi:dephospho-CoA kinase